MYFRYGEEVNEKAYRAAVHDGLFTYVVLDGGMGEEARRMDAAIRPLPENYQLVLAALDPIRAQKIEVYARQPQPAPIANSSSVRIVSPATGTVVNTNAGSVFAEGVTSGAQPGWYAQLDVFTNRWYAQPGNAVIAPDGSFRQQVVLGGQGAQQCYHLLRVRLFDQDGQDRAHSLNYGIVRANVDGSPPPCGAAQ